MRELQVYNGAMPQVAQQRFVQVQSAPKVEGHGEAVDRAVDKMVGMANKVIDLHDFSEGQKTELERRQIANDAEDALKSKLALPFDDEESLYLPDGRIDENKLNAFVNEWQQKYMGVKADFWRGENARKDAYRQQDDADRMNRSIRTAVLGRELQNRKQYFHDNVELAMLKGDYPGAKRAVNEAYHGGLFTETQRDIELLKLGQREEKKRLAEQAEAVRRNPMLSAKVSHDTLMGMVVPEPAVAVEQTQGEPAAAANGGEPAAPGAAKSGEPEEKKAETLNEAVTMGGGFGADTGETAAGDGLTSSVGGGIKEESLEENFRGKPATFSVNAAEREALMQETLENERAATLTLSAGGRATVQLSGEPSEESVRMAARADAAGAYTLEAHQRDVRLAAAEVLTNPLYASMTNEKKLKLIQQRAGLLGGADMFFGGVKEDYEGWLLNQAASVQGLGGAVKDADRMLAGHAGQMGIEALLLQEVTDEEVAAAWEEEGLHLGDSDAAKKVQEALYTKHKQEWVNATGAEPDEVMRVKDVKEFMKWYGAKKGLHADKRDAYTEALRNVYRERAIDAVLHLRATGRYELSSGQMVALDGKTDWAVEQRVIKDVLQRPVTREEHGTMEALAKQNAKLVADREARAKEYALKARAGVDRVKTENEKVKLKEFMERSDALAEEERREERKKALEKAQKEREKADKERMEGYSKRRPYFAKWDRVESGNDAAAVVSLPAAMYADVAKALKAEGRGFYVVLPGGGNPVPVKADENAKHVTFNRACFPKMVRKGVPSDLDNFNFVNGVNLGLKFTASPYAEK